MIHDALRGQRSKRRRRTKKRRRKRRREAVRNKPRPFCRQSVRVDPNSRAAAALSKVSVGRQTSQQ